MILRLVKVDACFQRLPEADFHGRLLPARADLQRDRFGGIATAVAESKQCLILELNTFRNSLLEAGGEPRRQRGGVNVAHIPYTFGAKVHLACLPVLEHVTFT